jgi:hypothetical protein
MVSYHRHISNYLFSIMPEMRFPGHVFRVGSDRDSIGDSSDSLHPSDIKITERGVVSANKKKHFGYIFWMLFYCFLCSQHPLKVR